MLEEGLSCEYNKISFRRPLMDQHQKQPNNIKGYKIQNNYRKLYYLCVCGSGAGVGVFNFANIIRFVIIYLFIYLYLSLSYIFCLL